MIQLNERRIKTINPDKYNIVVISMESHASNGTCFG